MFSRLFMSVSCCLLISLTVTAQNLSVLQGPSITICKDNQCVPSNSEMVRDYLLNQMNELMAGNIGKTIHLCEANPNGGGCIQKGISFPLSSPVIQTTATINQAYLVDAKAVKEDVGVDLILDYKVRAADTFPQCQTVLSRMGVASAADIKMMSPRFNCRLTETGKTTFSATYNVAYLDLDNGVIGAFYTIAAHNALNGSGAGYVLMQFDKGVEMEPGETFPYPAQLEAIMNGTMPPINDPEMLEKMGAFWLKPTPFLNLTTPEFAPNDCFEFQGGCSAEMLNEPAKAVPSAAEKLAALTPPNVLSTTGLIQQTMTMEDPKGPVMQQTVVTQRQVLENGKAIYETDSTRHYIQDSVQDAVREETEKAIYNSRGNKKAVFADSAKAIQKAQQDYQAMKQAEEYAKARLMAQQRQLEEQQKAMQQSQRQQPQLPENKEGTNSINKGTSSGKVVTEDVQVITPEGLILSDAERAYIEQLAVPEEDVIKKLDVESDLPVVIVDSTNQQLGNQLYVPAPEKEPDNYDLIAEPKAIVEVNQKAMTEETPKEVDADKGLLDDEAKAVVIPAQMGDVKDDVNDSLWNRLKSGVSGLFYF